MNQAYLWEKLGEKIQIALRDECIHEIMLNPDGKLWFVDTRFGTIENGKMSSDSAWAFVNALAQLEGKFLNEQKPFLDAILPFSGERINVTIPPIVTNVSFNIRKKAKTIFTLVDYLNAGIINEKQFSILCQAVRDRKNILISGSPASGKTTFANALLDVMAQVVPKGHRVLILEQVPELQCSVKNVKFLFETDHVSVNKLLWLAMRNSPDRLAFGEVRDGSVMDFLKACNTGCPGSIATIHANSPEAAVQRIFDLSSEISINPPYSLAAETLHIIVQIEAGRQFPGGRKVTSIVSVDGFNSTTKQFHFTKLDSEGENHHVSN